MKMGYREAGDMSDITVFLRKWKLQILCVAGGFLLYGAIVSGGGQTDDVSGGYLERGDYGTGTTTYEFMVDGLAEEPVA